MLVCVGVMFWGRPKEKSVKVTKDKVGFEFRKRRRRRRREELTQKGAKSQVAGRSAHAHWLHMPSGTPTLLSSHVLARGWVSEVEVRIF